jgi:hypothetical protein
MALLKELKKTIFVGWIQIVPKSLYRRMMNKKLMSLFLLLVVEVLEKIFPTTDADISDKLKKESVQEKSGDTKPAANAVQTTVFISADLFEDNMCKSDVIPASFISPPDCFGDGSSKAILKQISKIIKTIETAKVSARNEHEEDEE